MHCKDCGKKINNKAKFCVHCGNAIVSNVVKNADYPKPPKQKWSAWRIIKISAIVLIVGALILLKIGITAYNSIESESVTTNNEALSAFVDGNSEVAIQKMQKASQDASFDTNKLNTLKNLGYMYSSEGQNDKALSSFKKALPYTTDKTFEYYLVSGEIAILKKEMGTAQELFKKAYQLRPNDFQINNTLNLFYLDLEDIAPKYVNYKKALQYAKQALDASALDVRSIAQQNLAIAYFFNENYTESIKILSKFDTDKQPYLAYWLGLSYVSIENEKMGVFYLRKAINAGAEVPQEIHDYVSSH